MSQDILQKLKNLDHFSKFILILIIGLIFYLGFSTINSLQGKKSSSDLLEEAKNKSITLNEYFFEFYQTNRLANDTKLYLKINESITKEQLSNIEFRIIPNQKFEVVLVNENLIEILFLEKSPADLKENTLVVLENGKQLFRVNYKNLGPESSQADEIFYKRTE